MNVQIITNRKNPETYENNGIIYSTFDMPRSLDEFDIDVIDLSGEGIWYNREDDIRRINKMNDFKSIREMVIRKSRAKILYVFPMNEQFFFDYELQNYNSKTKTYRKHVLIKDHLDSIYNNIISYILPPKTTNIQAIYEPTETTVASHVFSADFFFEKAYSTLTKSNHSEKPTTVAFADNDIYLTSLNIASSGDNLLLFLNSIPIFDLDKKSEVPEWMSGIEFDDDREQNENIKSSLEIIKNEKEKIEAAKEKLSKNAKYKSIFYTNGDKLVSIVFQILEQLLECDLSEFVDKKKEDFLIRKDSVTFIGEIKGVTSNVKNEHISQVEVHYQGYIDRLIEEQRKENVHQLLIINTFRTKPVCEREPVSKQQIDLANRYGCLIIETTTLLRVFEKFLRHEITSEQSVMIISNNTGLLNVNDFEKLASEEKES